MNLNLAHPPKRICIVRLSALGDVVMHLPLVHTLKKAFPQCEVTWVTTHGMSAILDSLDDIETIKINKPKNLFDYWRFRRLMADRRFDILIASQASLRANLLYPLIKAPIKIGFDRQRAKDFHSLFVNHAIPFAKQHLVDSFLSFAALIGADEPVIKWDLPIADTDKQWALSHLPHVSAGPIIAINPAASKTERNWVNERYIDVMQHAKIHWNASFVLTGGPSDDEKAIAQAILTAYDGEVTNLVGKTNIKQLLAVLAQVDVLLSPDTGPAHLANAVGTPVVGLYAVAPSALSGPYLSQHLVVDKYSEAVKKILKQNPDSITWSTRVHDHQAMQLIQVNDVIEKLALVFQPFSK